AAILIHCAIDDREPKQVHSVIAAINKDRWGSFAKRIHPTRYRPKGIDRNVARVQEHAGSPGARAGACSAETYAAVAAGDKSNVVQEDVAAAIRFNPDTGFAVPANPDTLLRNAVTTSEAIQPVTSASCSATCASACSTSAAKATIAAIAADAGNSSDTNSAVAAADGAEIEHLHVS